MKLYRKVFNKKKLWEEMKKIWVCVSFFAKLSGEMHNAVKIYSFLLNSRFLFIKNQCHSFEKRQASNLLLHFIKVSNCPNLKIFYFISSINKHTICYINVNIDHQSLLIFVANIRLHSMVSLC